MNLAATPSPPYYAVIFSNEHTGAAIDDYEATAAIMLALAAEQPGFLGVEGARDDGLGITVSYWASEAAIAAWKADLDHRGAQKRGREEWYDSYVTRVARVERDYRVERD